MFTYLMFPRSTNKKETKHFDLARINFTNIFQNICLKKKNNPCNCLLKKNKNPSFHKENLEGLLQSLSKCPGLVPSHQLPGITLLSGRTSLNVFWEICPILKTVALWTDCSNTADFTDEVVVWVV